MNVKDVNETCWDFRLKYRNSIWIKGNERYVVRDLHYYPFSTKEYWVSYNLIGDLKFVNLLIDLEKFMDQFTYDEETNEFDEYKWSLENPTLDY